MVKPPLYENDKVYLLSKGGPEIRKSTGQGRVLTALLEAEKGIILPEIKRISSWKDPKRQMAVLSKEFNFWLLEHQVIRYREVDKMPVYFIDYY